MIPHELVISILIVPVLFAMLHIAQITPWWVVGINAVICVIVMGHYERKGDPSDYDLELGAWSAFSFFLIYLKL